MADAASHLVIRETGIMRYGVGKLSRGVNTLIRISLINTSGKRFGAVVSVERRSNQG